MFGHFCENRKENHLRKCEGERPVERLGDAFRLPPRDSDRRPGRGGAVLYQHCLQCDGSAADRDWGYCQVV